MRFDSINIYSDENQDGSRKKKITGMLRHDSDNVINTYLKLLKYYDNKQCKSLNVACNETIDEIYLQPFAKGYPIVHYPFDLSYYQSLREKEIERYWLDVIQESIRFVADKWDWDFSIFEDVYNKILPQPEREWNR